MAGISLRWLLASFVALLLVLPAAACPFCSMQGQTLTGEVNQASMVLFGTLKNAKLDPNAAFGQGTTELEIETVIKNNDILGGKKLIILPRYVPPTDATTKFLIFCDVFKGKIDPYRGIPVKANQDAVAYLKGALEVKDKPAGDRLKFFFKFLDSGDIEISNDAYKEFANADYKDYKDMAKELPADKIAKWLEDPDTATFRYGLYASMLGHCGGDKHAEVLRKMLDDQDKRLTSGADGVLAGYIMLKPEAGWKYLTDTLKDAKRDFPSRYAALRAARFFWDYRPDLVDKKRIVEGVCLLLDQGDIADLAIEDLRKWKRTEVADKILGLYDKESHDVRIVKRSILRYALAMPQLPQCAEFVDKLRKKDAEMVKDAEELLKLESTPPPAAVTKKAN